MRDIENPMVIDSHWRHLEPQSKVVGECAGCQEDIYSHEEWYEMQHIQQGNEPILVHSTDECCRQFVAEMSICRGPEE